MSPILKKELTILIEVYGAEIDKHTAALMLNICHETLERKMDQMEQGIHYVYKFGSSKLLRFKTIPLYLFGQEDGIKQTDEADDIVAAMLEAS